MWLISIRSSTLSSSSLGQSRQGKARPSGRYRGARIQFKQVHFGVFSTSRFAPLAFSSDRVWLLKRVRSWGQDTLQAGTFEVIFYVLARNNWIRNTRQINGNKIVQSKWQCRPRAVHISQIYHLFKQHIYCGQPDRHIYGSGEGLRDGIPEKCSFLWQTYIFLEVKIFLPRGV